MRKPRLGEVQGLSHSTLLPDLVPGNVQRQVQMEILCNGAPGFLTAPGRFPFGQGRSLTLNQAQKTVNFKEMPRLLRGFLS